MQLLRGRSCQVVRGLWWVSGSGGRKVEALVFATVGEQRVRLGTLMLISMYACLPRTKRLVATL